MSEQQTPNSETEQSRQKLELEDHNFRVNSDGWKEITVDNINYLVDDTESIWEFNEGECQGEQLFTWEAMMRETEKAGKRVPTDKEFNELLKEESDMPNMVLVGFRGTNGSSIDLGEFATFWSSSPENNSHAWGRFMDSSFTKIYQRSYSKVNGLSVRCIKS